MEKSNGNGSQFVSATSVQARQGERRSWGQEAQAGEIKSEAPGGKVLSAPFGKTVKQVKVATPGHLALLKEVYDNLRDNPDAAEGIVIMVSWANGQVTTAYNGSFEPMSMIGNLMQTAIEFTIENINNEKGK